MKKLTAFIVTALILTACNQSTMTTATTFTIGGTVSGLTSDQRVILFDNGNDALTLTANGNFTFVIPITSGGSYSVTVDAQPTEQTCKITNGSGIASANVTGVAVNCLTNTFTIGGTVSGLETGQEVTLANGTGSATVSNNGSFTFATPINYGGSYDVTVSSQPTGQTCTVSAGSGSDVTDNIASVAVACTVNSFTVGGTLSGLTSGQVTLTDDGGNALTLSAGGNFVFSTPIAYDGSYNVVVSAQPPGQTCVVNNSSGNVLMNIATINVVCTVNTATLTWTPPTENTDGSTLTDLSGYTIFYGTDSSSLNQTIQITDPTATIYTISNLLAGTYYFSIVANASDGTQSTSSNVASKTF